MFKFNIKRSRRCVCLAAATVLQLQFVQLSSLCLTSEVLAAKIQLQRRRVLTRMDAGAYAGASANSEGDGDDDPNEQALLGNLLQLLDEDSASLAQAIPTAAFRNQNQQVHSQSQDSSASAVDEALR